MINKAELSGCWWYVSQREGWSTRIAKRKWLVFDLIFSICVMTLAIWLLSFFLERIWFQSAWVGYAIVISSALLNHKAWNRDQEKIRDRADA